MDYIIGALGPKTKDYLGTWTPRAGQSPDFFSTVCPILVASLTTHYREQDGDAAKGFGLRAEALFPKLSS